MVKIRLFRVNRALSVEEKGIYFKMYIAHKERLRSWHKADKDYRGIDLYQTDKIFLSGDIWEDLMEEQLYEPKHYTKLTNRIW